MTAMIQVIRLSPPTTLMLSLWSMISKLLCDLEAGILAQRDYARYDAMNDEQLAGSGLTREQVPALVVRRMLQRCSQEALTR